MSALEWLVEEFNRRHGPDSPWPEAVLDEWVERSPLAIRCLKSAFNADLDGQAGLQELAGNATLLYYMGDEAKEFHRAQREKRKPEAKKFPWLP